MPKAKQAKLQSKELLYRPTWAEIDLSALTYNVGVVKNLIAKGVKILAALKADAYGHGAVMVAKHLVRCGVEYFGVATLKEAIELRDNGITAKILLLTQLLPVEFPSLLNYKVIPTIADVTIASRLNGFLKQRKKKLPVHIEIDTGMGRLGIWHDEALDSVAKISRLGQLIIEGIYTHFPCADSDEPLSRQQIKLFSNLNTKLSARGIQIPLQHAANSEAVMRFKDAQYTLVRPGIMMYGLYADMRSRRSFDLRPALSFKTKITFLKKISQGRSVSYGRTFIAKRDSTIATLPVGYADGYNRLLSNRAKVLVRGRRCPVTGRICMDHTMIDVTGVGAKVGDEVVLIGRQNGLEIRAEEIAQLCSTISYEAVCWISKRVPRIYIN